MTEFVEAISELTPKQKELLQKLHLGGQSHLFNDFHQASLESRKTLASQLEALDESYSTGILGYTKRARVLLEDSRNGVNPLDGWTPSVPKGEAFELGTPEYQETEAIGIQELSSIGFVLVAGGLGERLGYSGIKVGARIPFN
jgi:UDP-sugar pyrophosphorylase